MAKEQEEAIKRLEEQLNFWKKQNIKNSDCEIILNLVTKLQKENGEKDKQIDLMAEVIYKRTNYKELNKYCNKKDKNKCESYTECYNCIKQYFERKAKK